MSPYSNFRSRNIAEETIAKLKKDLSESSGYVKCSVEGCNEPVGNDYTHGKCKECFRLSALGLGVSK